MAAHAAAKEAVWSHHKPTKAAALMPGKDCKTPSRPQIDGSMVCSLGIASSRFGEIV